MDRNRCTLGAACKVISGEDRVNRELRKNNVQDLSLLIAIVSNARYFLPVLKALPKTKVVKYVTRYVEMKETRYR